MKWLATSVMLVVSAVNPTLARADLIVNGGFETGNFTGWSITTNSLTFVGQSGVNYFGKTFSSHSGSYYAFIAHPNEATIRVLTQSISTVVGGIYELQFWLGEDDYGSGLVNNQLKVSAGGVVLDNFIDIAKTNYALHTYQFIATSTSTLIRFDTFDEWGVMLLDDISVNTISTPVPVPGGIVTWGIGFALIGIHRIIHLNRKRARQA